MFPKALPVLIAAAVFAIAVAARSRLESRDDKHCGTSICVYGRVHGKEVTYTMMKKEDRTDERLGWIAMGFGLTMVEYPSVPMIVAWSYKNQTIISQRTAIDYDNVSVVEKPPFPLRLSNESYTHGNQSRIAFTIPWDGKKRVKIIYAFSNKGPKTSNSSAEIVDYQHNDYGRLSFDLEQA
ncbi:hypothetical protein HGRIS_003036 [Hohenbuehelia grisea]|uniref:Cellobiose dehydrogenase-like cytochrome domain-containing protein n=1 Tax=Hohenbuehelia grisea TaxID=104357 RepID=A0ABR3JN42_9AGAR